MEGAGKEVTLCERECHEPGIRGHRSLRRHNLVGGESRWGTVGNSEGLDIHWGTAHTHLHTCTHVKVCSIHMPLHRCTQHS